MKFLSDKLNSLVKILFYISFSFIGVILLAEINRAIAEDDHFSSIVDIFVRVTLIILCVLILLIFIAVTTNKEYDKK